MTHRFSDLRAANAARLPTFRSRSGELCHTSPAAGLPVGFDWDRTAWCMALLGEVGELANELKKVQRGDATLQERREAIGNEATDVLTYLDFVAWRFGTSLERALLTQYGFSTAPEGGLTLEALQVAGLREMDVSLNARMVGIGECTGILCRVAIDADRIEPEVVASSRAGVRLSFVQSAIAHLANHLFLLLHAAGIDAIPAIATKWNAVSVRVNSPVRLWVSEGTDAGPG